MYNINKLYDIYQEAKFEITEWNKSVDWALDVLANNGEGDDFEIGLLACSKDTHEIIDLTKSILNRYMQIDPANDEYWAGKYIVTLNDLYFSKKIDIIELDSILYKIYCQLDNPDWLEVLSQNCENAIDVASFENHFLDEFEYITNLWRDAKTLQEFYSKYDRNKSNSHDI